MIASKVKKQLLQKNAAVAKVEGFTSSAVTLIP